MRADRYYPGFKGNNLRWYPDDLVLPDVPVEGGKIWYVDGDQASGSHSGTSWEDAWNDAEFDGALSSISSSISAGDVIYVAGRTMTQKSTDPASYTTNLTIDVPQISIIGISRGRTQGGLPQMKVGATTTQAIFRVRAPGVLIQNLGFNGAGATGGGIRFDDDGGTTYASLGGSVLGCHFKNCKGTTATDSRTGGAIQMSGAPWQMNFSGNHFYRNVGGIVLLDTSNAVPQDVVIQGNTFLCSETSATDCDIYMAGGSGCSSLIIDSNVFTDLPALGSGSVVRFMDLTGCSGIVSRNMFGALVAEGATEVTFEAAGTAAKIPTTVFMAGNFGQFHTGVGSGLVSGEVFA